MTKSQNTKNEQHCIKQNEKIFIQNDLSLTELWQKGELPSGWYWVECSRAEGIYAYTAEYLNNMYRPINSERIIERVPTYDEWQAKLEENAQLKKQINHLLRTQARQFVDNQKLQVKAEKAKDVVNFDMARQIILLKELMKETKTAISSALNFLACSDRISETECNEQLAFDVLRKALEDLEK